MKTKEVESCAICGCPVWRSAETARPTIAGRSLATEHPYVPERFFRRSADRHDAATGGLFDTCPWGQEKQATVCCRECHEELMHNPVLLPADIQAFAELVRKRGLGEDDKPETKDKIAGRVLLLHEVIATGLLALGYLEAVNAGRPQGE
jgi:hypothetical protein